MRRREFLVAATTFLSGCVGPPALPQMQSPVSIRGCCSRLAEAKYLPCALHNTLRLAIDEDSPTFEFSTGTSRFVGLQLESEAEDLVLELTTAITGIWIPPATIFVPSLQFLDISFGSLASVEAVLYQNTGKLQDDSWSTYLAAPNTYYAAQFVPRGTKYVVIFCDVSKLSSNVKYVIGGSFGLDLQLDKMRNEVYRPIDRRDYAAGRVKPFQPGRPFTTREIKRAPSGEFRVLLTSTRLGI